MLWGHEGPALWPSQMPRKKKADRAVSLPRSITLNAAQAMPVQPSWFLVIKHILGGFA